MGKEGVESGEKEPLHPQGRPLWTESRPVWTEIRSNAQWTFFEKSWKESI